MDFVTIDNTDTIVYKIAHKLRTRSDKGKQTYGTTLDRTDLSTKQWLDHAIEEALDLALYLERIKKSIMNQEKKYVVFNIGCLECGVSSNIVGVFTTIEKAEEIKEKCKDLYNWREGGQNEFEIFELPEVNYINKEYKIYESNT